jgi:hypothetical protein
MGGPIRFTPYWHDNNFSTFKPGLCDHIGACESELGTDAGAYLRDRVHAAVRLADEGRDQEALDTLAAFRVSVESLRREGRLTDARAAVLDTLAEAGQRRLRP